MKRVAGGIVIALLALVASSVKVGAAADGCDAPEACTGFEQGEYEVSEADGYIQVPVFAAFCCPVEQGQVDYRTVGRTAVPGQDFVQTSGTLTFAGGGRQDIVIPISSDQLSEAAERFEIRLTAYRGTFVHRHRESTTVIILDRDPNAAWVDAASPEQPVAGDVREGEAAPPSRGPSTSTSTTALEAALAPDDLMPGPGFELASNRAPVLASSRERGKGGGGSWFALGLGTTVAGAGGAVWARRRRWSPTRA